MVDGRREGRRKRVKRKTDVRKKGEGREEEGKRRRAGEKYVVF